MNHYAPVAIQFHWPTRQYPMAEWAFANGFKTKKRRQIDFDSMLTTWNWKAKVALGVSALCATYIIYRYTRHYRRAAIKRRYSHIDDSFQDLEQIQNALLECGMRRCEMIVGIDYSLSTRAAGLNSFGGHSLHQIVRDEAKPDPNPFQFCLFMLGKCLKPFDSDGFVEIYGVHGCQAPSSDSSDSSFSSNISSDDRVPFFALGSEREAGFESLLTRYTDASVELSGQSPDWSALIDYAAESAMRENAFHLLALITAGAMSDRHREAAHDALVRASKAPLGVLFIGVGDGPFDELEALDDDERSGAKFDNVQFVDLIGTVQSHKHPDVAFALACLMEVPQWHRAVSELGYLQ
jgi:E3 ubiquitin-protein ligase RGLG